jgi:hypothetical protein
VSMLNKSVASSPAAWVRRKVRQLVSDSRGAGPTLPAARIRRMVPAPTRRPRPTSSPCPRRCPSQILPGRAHDKVADLVANPRAAGPIRVRPVPADHPAVPGRQRGRGDDAMPPQLAGKGADQGGEHGPVRPGQPRPADLATQHGDFVAQHQQLGDHRGLAPRDLRQPAEHPNCGQVQQSNNHAPHHRELSENGSSQRCASSSGAVQGRADALFPDWEPDSEQRPPLAVLGHCGVRSFALTQGGQDRDVGAIPR